MAFHLAVRTEFPRRAPPVPWCPSLGALLLRAPGVVLQTSHWRRVMGSAKWRSWWFRVLEPRSSKHRWTHTVSRPRPRAFRRWQYGHQSRGHSRCSCPWKTQTCYLPSYSIRYHVPSTWPPSSFGTRRTIKNAFRRFSRCCFRRSRHGSRHLKRRWSPHRSRTTHSRFGW